ncbi:MAG: Lrp/AsnC family transcriptional regulator [Actinomycetia bacterium]|nr:Lrp/AsnC family transcriptional regulator [Actinomycetes bacterium]MCP3912205.1 Lrp/AsnC family transcriptional regulator [Actinomycetes bacterium]MCP4088062.1 Lrp/AsnC family transcriptional regulator [Actinomycetes bacterium]
MTPLDSIDVLLLEELQRDGRATNTEIADRVGLSPSAVLRRTRRLEDSGVIAGYAMLIEPHTIDRHVDVFVEISLESQTEDRLDAFEEAVVQCPRVMSCHLMAGAADYLLHLAVADTLDYEQIHRQYLSNLPGVASIRSNFAMRTVHSTTAYSLAE